MKAGKEKNKKMKKMELILFVFFWFNCSVFVGKFMCNSFCMRFNGFT